MEEKTAMPPANAGAECCPVGGSVHEHGHNCDCASDHGGKGSRDCDCGCGHDRACDCDEGAQGHRHALEHMPAEEFDPNKVGLGWEGVCPCGCGGSVHHHGEDDSAAEGGAASWELPADLPAWDGVSDAVGWPADWDETANEPPSLISYDVDDFEEVEDLPKPILAEMDFSYDGVSYHVRRWGDPADIPLLALHGFMQTGATWEHVAPRLCRGRCVYAVDLVGHGASDKPADAAAYAIPAIAEALAAFVKEVMLPQNVQAVGEGGRLQTHVHVLGYSMGGRIALELTLRHPELVYTLVLESAGLGPRTQEDRAAYAQRAAEWAHMLREEGVRAFVDYWEQLPLFASQQHLGQDIRDAVREERLANDAEALALTVENSGQHTMPTERENRERLSYCWTPVLYVCGSRDDKYLAHAEDLQRMGLDTKAIMGGHNLHLEQPDDFLQALEAFYRRNEMRGR